MISLLKSITLWLPLCLGSKVILAESLPIKDGIFQTNTITITAVFVSKDTINIKFTGIWLDPSPVPSTATTKNGFVISRDKSVSKSDWQALANRFKKGQSKQVAIIITPNGSFLASRGGIPMFTYPKTHFALVLPGRKSPIQYKF